MDLYYKVGEKYRLWGKVELATEPAPETPASGSRMPYTEAFEAFWASYPKPRRVGKGGAWKAWVKAGCSKVDQALLLAALEAAKKTEQWIKDGNQYAPLPATWINQRRWEDYEPPSAAMVLAPSRPGVCPGFKQDRCNLRMVGGGMCDYHKAMADDDAHYREQEPEFIEPDEQFTDPLP